LSEAIIDRNITQVYTVGLECSPIDEVAAIHTLVPLDGGFELVLPALTDVSMGSGQKF